jgi:hypothetical protein
LQIRERLTKLKCITVTTYTYSSVHEQQMRHHSLGRASYGISDLPAAQLPLRFPVEAIVTPLSDISMSNPDIKQPIPSLKVAVTPLPSVKGFLRKNGAQLGRC